MGVNILNLGPLFRLAKATENILIKYGSNQEYEKLKINGVPNVYNFFINNNGWLLLIYDNCFLKFTSEFKNLDISAVGGGGGGGGRGVACDATTSAGGGGGSGGCLVSETKNIPAFSEYSIIIGAGGDPGNELSGGDQESSNGGPTITEDHNGQSGGSTKISKYSSSGVILSNLTYINNTLFQITADGGVGGKGATYTWSYKITINGKRYYGSDYTGGKGGGTTDNGGILENRPYGGDGGTGSNGPGGNGRAPISLFENNNFLNGQDKIYVSSGGPGGGGHWESNNSGDINPGHGDYGRIYNIKSDYGTGGAGGGYNTNGDHKPAESGAKGLVAIRQVQTLIPTLQDYYDLFDFSYMIKNNEEQDINGTYTEDYTYQYNETEYSQILSFLTSGTFIPGPDFPAIVDICAVGGGGGGGFDAGGGGGSGYQEVQTNVSLSSSNLYDIAIGEGGNGSTKQQDSGEEGNPSSFDTIITAEGGKGGGSFSTSPKRYGGNGGSGGGKGGTQGTPGTDGGSEGLDGASGNSILNAQGSSNYTVGTGANQRIYTGGIMSELSIPYYGFDFRDINLEKRCGGGGGGSVSASAGGVGGYGGGGNGGTDGTNNTEDKNGKNGTPYTGGGGGGAAGNGKGVAGNGGSGIILIRPAGGQNIKTCYKIYKSGTFKSGNEIMRLERQTAWGQNGGDIDNKNNVLTLQNTITQAGYGGCIFGVNKKIDFSKYISLYLNIIEISGGQDNKDISNIKLIISRNNYFNSNDQGWNPDSDSSNPPFDDGNIIKLINLNGNTSETRNTSIQKFPMSITDINQEGYIYISIASHSNPQIIKITDFYLI